VFYLKEHLMSLFGLSDREARLYLAALEFGESPVYQLAKQTGINRTTAYDILARLVDAGFVTRHKKNGQIYVVPESPELLLRRYELKMQRLHNLVPDLNALHLSSSAKPHIKLYEGAPGIQAALNHALTCKSGLVNACLSMAEILEQPGLEAIERFQDERVRLNIELRVVRAREEDVTDIWGTDHSIKRELRYAPDLDSFSMTMFIYDDYVNLLSSRRENFGLIIQSEEFAGIQRYLFERLWKNSQKV